MKYCIFSLFVLLCVTQCSNRLDDDIRSVVLSYNNALAEGYRTGEMGKIESLVSPEQLVLIREKFNGFPRLKLQHSITLRSVEFSEITLVSPNAARVVTEESWDYRIAEVGKGDKRANPSIRFKSFYDLEKYPDGWVVAAVDAHPFEDFTFKHEVGIPPIPVHISLPSNDADIKKVLTKTVMTYITLLADGYKKQDMSALVHSATKNRALKAYHHMSSMGEGGVRMEPRLLAIQIPEAGLLSGSNGQVRTREEWDYTYYATKTGDEVYKNHVRYTLTYDLIKDDIDRWLVDNIRIDNMEQEEGKGELPFFNRPQEEIVNE